MLHATNHINVSKRPWHLPQGASKRCRKQNLFCRRPVLLPSMFLAPANALYFCIQLQWLGSSLLWEAKKKGYPLSHRVYLPTMEYVWQCRLPQLKKTNKQWTSPDNLAFTLRNFCLWSTSTFTLRSLKLFHQNYFSVIPDDTNNRFKSLLIYAH